MAEESTTNGAAQLQPGQSPEVPTEAQIDALVAAEKGKVKATKGSLIKPEAKDKDGKPVAAAAAPAADPAADKAAARRAQLDRLAEVASAQKAAFRAKQDAKAAKAKSDADAAAEQARVAQAAQQSAAQRDKELSDTKAALDRATKDPIGWLNAQGVKATDIAKRILDEGKGAAAAAAPGADALKVAQEAAAAELERIKSEAVAAIQKEKDQVAAERAAVAEERAQAAYLAAFESGRAKYPFMCERYAGQGSHKRILRDTLALIEDIRQDPDTAPFIGAYRFEDYLDFLEAESKEEVSRIRGKPAPAAVADQAGKTPGEASATRQGQKSRTLSNRQSSQVASPKDEYPEGYWSWSSQKQTRYWVDQHKAGRLKS